MWSQNGFAARSAGANPYDETYTYDGNGNILTLDRMDAQGQMLHNFDYYYYKGTNKLRGVLPIERDTVYNAAINSNNKLYRDIHVQATARPQMGIPAELRATRDIKIDNNFEAEEGNEFAAYIPEDGPFIYDAIGNLTTDQEEGSKISWTPYGKVREVKTKNDSVTVRFRYDATGNRIEKRVEKFDTVMVTRYMRDASGNVMTIYQDTTILEQPIYGSARLGMNVRALTEGTQTLGGRNYELSNHLSNVLAVITDNLHMLDDSVWTSVVSTSDYYPFGLEMQGRNWEDSISLTSRYGFNGKEKDDNGEFGNSVYDYGFRIYNPSIGKFLSVDPLTKSYPMLTPYQFAANMPVRYIDLDGLEPANNPDNPANQDDRNPTATINTIYGQNGGDEQFKRSFPHYLKGTFNPNATLTGIINKEGYASDSDEADMYNHWVNNKGIFYADEYENFGSETFSNFLLGMMINGVGPENIVFPLNGLVSSYLKDAGVVKDAMNDWYDLNKGRCHPDFESVSSKRSGNAHNPRAIFEHGFFGVETMIGSVSVTIAPLNDKEVLVRVFNVMSLTSGDFEKHFPWNNYPISVVRDPTLPEGSPSNRYGNTSQIFTFTLPVDMSKLIK